MLPQGETKCISTYNGTVGSIMIISITLDDSTTNLRIIESCIIAANDLGLFSTYLTRSNSVQP